MCREGPLPNRYLRVVDIPCLVIFIMLLIFIVIVLIIDGSHAGNLSDGNEQNNYLSVTISANVNKYVMVGVALIV